MKHEETLTVACPQCNAPEGKPCRPATKQYAYEPTFYAHKARHLSAAVGASFLPPGDAVITLWFDRPQVDQVLDFDTDIKAVKMILGKWGKVA